MHAACLRVSLGLRNQADGEREATVYLAPFAVPGKPDLAPRIGLRFAL